MENGIIIRIFVLILLALAIFLYFLLNDNAHINQKFNFPKIESLKYSPADLDSAVEKVFFKFDISKNQIKRNEIRFTKTDFVRIDRRVYVPDDSLSLLINLELKKKMDDYGLKVSGTENFQEKITTLFIIDKGTILQSIGFKSKK